MQKIFVGQTKAKVVDNMWTEVCDADRGSTEHMLRGQQLELEMWRLKADLATSRASLEAEQSAQDSIERLIVERDEMIGERDEMIVERDEIVAVLRDQLSICQGANRDLSSCTAKLADAI